MLLLVDNYDSFTFILYQYLLEFTLVEVIRNDEPLRQDWMQRYKGIVLSPGPGLPQTSGNLMQFLSLFIGEKPILGVCLGHQAIALHFGAQLQQTKEIFHGRPSTIHHKSNGIFRGIPEGFLANRYHSWAVAKETLPNEIEVTAETHDGVIMGIQVRAEKPIFGIQFHPESILTQYGRELLKNFVEETSR